MRINKIFPYPFLDLGVKSLLSNDSMLAFFKKFCHAITSRIWKYRKPRNWKYTDMDFLKVFFFAEIMGRSIHECSEMLNERILSLKRGRRKLFTDGRRRRMVPHQTEVNKYLRKIGLKRARNILRECLDFQLLEALSQDLISRKVNVLIDFTEHPYYGKREDKMIKGTNRQKGRRKCVIILDFRFFLEVFIYTQDWNKYQQGNLRFPLSLNFSIICSN